MPQYNVTVKCCNGKEHLIFRALKKVNVHFANNFSIVCVFKARRNILRALKHNQTLATIFDTTLPVIKDTF